MKLTLILFNISVVVIDASVIIFVRVVYGSAVTSSIVATRELFAAVRTVDCFVGQESASMVQI